MNRTDEHYVRTTHLTEIVDLQHIARGINMDIDQLDAGSFESDVIQLKARNVLASLVTSNRRLRVRGTVSFLTFQVPLEAPRRLRWNGIALEPNDIVAVNAGESFDYVYPAGVKPYCISVIGDAEATLRNLGGPVLARKLSETARPMPCDPDAVRSMARWLADRFDSLGGDSIFATAFAFDLEQEFLRRLAACVRAGRSRSGGAVSTRSVRIDAARRVEEHLLANLAVPQTVDDLCRVAGTSRRTLEYAFREHFGTSPKSFVKALRLNAARNDLLRSNYGSTLVAEVAAGWGFTHMSQFSSDYRHMFGERPSATLRRAQKR